MNQTTAAVIILVILILGGVLFYSTKDRGLSTYTNTSTSTVTNTGQNTSSPQVAQTAAAPTVLTSSTVFPTDTTVTLQGTVTPNGALTNYWYEYGTTPNFGNSISHQMIGSGYAAIPAPAYITGLRANTTYYFRLVAQNQLGVTTGEQRSFKTTQGNPPPVGGLPTVKTSGVSGISKTTVNLNGQVNPNKASTSYWFEYGKTANLGNTTVFTAIGNGDTTVAASVPLSGLDPATTYYFRLNAQNQFGTINGSILTFKTAGPPEAKAPSVVTSAATAIKTSMATINGIVNPNNAETTYWFEYSTDPLLSSVLLKSTSHKSAGSGSADVSIAANISSLTASTTYYFRLVAQNNQGILHGATLSFTTK
ncbi:MAG: fibronectin type III domain-containing protein [Patescibacteria group bacterium]